MINLVGENLTTLKNKKTGNPETILHVDLSANDFKSGEDLLPYKNLKTLVIDDNKLSSLETFPIFKFL
jgi:hypothetical protein